MTPQVQMPHYDLHDRNGVLIEDFVTMTRIKGRTCNAPTIKLLPTGELWIAEGEEWDFGTGAIDTPAVILASLVHDKLIELIFLGLLPTTLRRRIDKEYKRYLKIGGMRWLRRQWQYHVIRFYVRFIKPWYEKDDND